MPSFFTSGNTAALIGASRGWNFITRVACAFSPAPRPRVGLAQERQRAAVGAGRGLDDVRQIRSSRRDAVLPPLRASWSSTVSAASLPACLPCGCAGRSRRGGRCLPARCRPEREGVFDVGACRRSSGASSSCVVLAQMQARRLEAEVGVPADSGGRASTRTTSRDSAGWQKNSISICSNSRERNVKFRGVISLRKLLPIWAMPNGTRTRVLSKTFLKLTKMPWAVSGRR